MHTGYLYDANSLILQRIMVNIDTFIQLALSFPGTEANPHFDRMAFKVTGKRIFATLHEENRTANLKFSKADQHVYCSFNNKTVYPVANKWGLQGWTTFELDRIPAELISDALETAYKDVFTKVKTK